MEIMDIKTTPLEVDRKCWVYSNGNSIPFKEIELEIQNKLSLIKVRVFGEYNENDLSIEPIVFVQADYEGYHYRFMLEKRLFNDNDSIENFYNWLAEKIAHGFAVKLFLKGE